MQLTPENQAAIDQFNTLGSSITDTTMQNFIPQWYTNIRRLLKTSFPLHNVEELSTRLHKQFDSFTVLGSGPSAPEICASLPKGRQALFCGPTALGALSLSDLRPTALIVADSSPKQYLYLKETRLRKPHMLDIVLPITADPLWYDENSVCDRSRLYFYLPYYDYMGDTNIAYNHIMKALFPEVTRYIAQAGSVAATALNVANMCCGEDADKRIYVGVDCSWTKGGPRRSPMRFPLDDYSAVMKDWFEKSSAPAPAASISFGEETIESDLLSLGYAVQVLYLMNYYTNLPYASSRHVLLTPSAKLYRAAAPDVVMPLAKEPFGPNYFSFGEDKWPYKVMLKIIEISNALQNRLLKENENAKSQGSN
jgi:hypothetical protein